jgi:hypothetical protein
MRYLLFTVIIAASLAACDQSVKGKNGQVYRSAVEYNDYIISRQTILIKNMLDLKEVAQTNLDSADKMLDKTIPKIEKMITDIRGMPPYKEDSSFRDAAIGSFIFYKKLFANEYKKIVNIRKNGKDAADEGIMEMKKIIDQIKIEEEKYDKGFHNAQKDFADKNHMKLEENSMQKKINKVK